MPGADSLCGSSVRRSVFGWGVLVARHGWNLILWSFGLAFGCSPLSSSLPFGALGACARGSLLFLL